MGFILICGIVWFIVGFIVALFVGHYFLGGE